MLCSKCLKEIVGNPEFCANCHARLRFDMGTSRYSPSEMQTRSVYRVVAAILFFIVALFSVVGIVYGLGFVPSPEWESYGWALVGLHSVLFAVALAGGIMLLKGTSSRSLAFINVHGSLFFWYLLGVISYFVKWPGLPWSPIVVQFAALVLLIMIAFCAGRANTYPTEPV